MDKKIFKSSVMTILKENVSGLTEEQKIKYMKKWIIDYERSLVDRQTNPKQTNSMHIDPTIKIGALVRATIKAAVKAHLLPLEKVQELEDKKYCKYTFDINYPLFKKVSLTEPLHDQKNVNGYSRYWADVITIHGQRYLICNDWYERNKTKFIRWVEELG
jgi:hypothetical protein